VELCFAAFFGAAMFRRLWLSNFDFDACFTLSTFLDTYSVAGPRPRRRVQNAGLEV